MAIPVVYNLRSVKERWTSAVVAVLGIAGTVGVFIAMLSLAFGLQGDSGFFRLQRQRDGPPRRLNIRDGQQHFSGPDQDHGRFSRRSPCATAGRW